MSTDKSTEKLKQKVNEIKESKKIDPLAAMRILQGYLTSQQ